MRNHTARRHFNETVLGAYSDFVAEYSSREIGLGKDTRRAAAVAEALLDLPEHLYIESDGVKSEFDSARKYRESHWLNCRAYEVICDIGNVWKHGKVSRDGRKLERREALMECIGVVRHSDKLGVYTWSRKVLEVKLLSGTSHHVAPLLRECVEYWSEELIARSVIPRLPNISIGQPVLMERDDPRGNGVMHLHAYRLEPEAFKFKAYAYDPLRDDLIELSADLQVGDTALVECKITVHPSLYDI